MADNLYDAIVVGSGITGGWAAKELCEKGLKTLVLERGRDIDPVKDFADSSKDPWELPHRGHTTRQDAVDSPIQSQKGAYNEVSKKFFVNDLENPYIQKKPFDWIRGYQVGGRSIIWGRQCYRWSDLDFGANARDGHGVDWPIRYKDIEPWYDYVEPFVGISGSMEGLPQLPDGKFLPPMELNCVEKDVAARIKKHYADGRCLIIGRTANLSRQVGDRGPCQYRDRCNQGCPFKGYFSSHSATLPAAGKTGNLRIRPLSIVQEILYDRDTKKATGVRIIDAATLRTKEYYAKVIFLNASTIGSAFILLNSTSEVFPDGLGTARMGRDPKTSVLNKWNQLHDVKNVFVTDGACMSSSACQNPSLTYMALTARAADYAVSELKKGNL